MRLGCRCAAYRDARPQGAAFAGGLLAQSYSPWNAATLGVYLHGLAADTLAQTRPYGYTASDVADMLPQVIGTCLNAKPQELPC